MITETRRRERGHRFYPPADEFAAIPALYATEHISAADKVIHLHYFVRDCDGWIAEVDPDTGLAFGYACLHGDAGNAEWGYIDLTELESLCQPAQVQTDRDGRPVRLLPHLIVERELHWAPSSRWDRRAPRMAGHRLITPCSGPAGAVCAHRPA